MNSPVSAQPTQSGAQMRAQDILWRDRARVLILWAVTLLLSIAILVVRFPTAGQMVLRPGDVAPTDITAPRQVTYVSQLLTAQRRDLAAAAVPEVYDGIQARIGRQQLALANQILDFIGTVRSDSLADLPTKAAYVRAITALDLPPEIITRTLTLPSSAWDRVADEIQTVLERAMRDEIRENTLEVERRKVPARVRLDLSDEDAAVVSAFVQDLLVPNSFLNVERTERRRQEARESVAPVTASVERNEIILRAGDIVTALDIEALEALGLQQAAWTWRDAFATASFMFVLALVFLYYTWRQEPQLWTQHTEQYILALGTLLFLFAGKAAIPAHTLLPYLFPYAALAMTASVLIHTRLALVASGLLAIGVGWLAGGSIELAAYALCSALVGTLKLRQGERLASYAWAGGLIIAANLAVIAAFRLAGGQWDLRGLAELSAAAVSNGLITITTTLVAIYVTGALFGIATPLQLLELARPTHPLLRQLLLKAPGTYHHTLIVSNMAERAAEAIGADALLTRVGTYYHDVGKTIRPYFFIENRSESVDPHARLDPYTSAQIIASHVKDGIDLARKYRLPQRVIDFIPEHQGTLLIAYFYHRAVQQAGSAEAVDQALFRYPGPRPRSRETAIAMLADGAEATVRSRRPASVEAMEQIVAESIQARLMSGQLEECPLTLADLAVIRRAFVDVLRGLHHPRIDYPPEAGVASTAPAVEVPELVQDRLAAPAPKSTAYTDPAIGEPSQAL